MVAAGVLICLLVGSVMIALPRQWNSLAIASLGGLLVLCGLLSPCAIAPGLPRAWESGWWSAGVWWLGFGWTTLAPTRGGRTDHQALGWMSLAAGGLLLAATANDWVQWALALEIVRLATIPGRCSGTASTDAPGNGEISGLWISGLAIAAWLSVTGAVSFEEWHAVLRESYQLRPEGVPFGRASLVLIVATGLTLLAACSPVLWTWRTISGWETAEPLGTKLASLCARQLAALLALRRLFEGGVPGLEATWIIGLFLLAGLSWLVACRWLTDRQHFDRLIVGLVQLSWGSLLIWLAPFLGQAPQTHLAGALISSLAPDSGWLMAVLLHTLTTAGVAASAAGLATPLHGIYYLDQFRGSATTAPWRTALLAIGLGSLLGLPGLAGFWVRVSWLLSLLGVHQLAADDSVLPHHVLRLAACIGAVVIILGTATLFRILRVMVLEIPVGRDTPYWTWWMRSVAVVMGAVVFLWGLAPSWWP